MPRIVFLLILFLISCNHAPKNKESDNENAAIKYRDTLKVDSTSFEKINAEKSYANLRFRKVIVKKLKAGKFRIQGEAQIFESRFKWILEDDEKEIKSGYTMTSEGAPAWGFFDFTVEAFELKDPSNLKIKLCEMSAKDGSLQNELSIPLNN